MIGRIQTMKTKKQTRPQVNRRGGFWTGPLSSLLLSGLLILVLIQTLFRAEEIIKAVSGNDRPGTIAVVPLVSLILFADYAAAIGLFYGVARFWPRLPGALTLSLCVGIPLGFNITPLRLPLSVYFSNLLLSVLAVTFTVFLIERLISSSSFKVKRTPIPEELPAISEEAKRKQRGQITDIEEASAEPNSWQERYRTVAIYQDYATVAYNLDGDIDEFRSMYSLYCQKDLLIYHKQCEDDVFIECVNGYCLERTIQPCAALDFEGAQDWATFARETLPEHLYQTSRREEQVIRGLCAAILRDEKELEKIAQKLKKSTGFLDYLMTVQSGMPKFWISFLEGLAEHNVDLCTEAIRIQSEQWYSPEYATDSVISRLNVIGVAMSNLCRWRGVNVPALEPVVPEELLLPIPEKQEGPS